MVKPRAARKKPIVLSSDTDEDGQRSPPPKRPKRGTLLSISNRARGDAKVAKAQTRRASSPKPSSPSAKKSPAKSPGKPKPVYKSITSFFGVAPRPQIAQPTPSPEKSVASTPLEHIDDICDSSDDDQSAKRPAALLVRKGKAGLAAENDNLPKGSQRFLRAANGARNTPPPSQTTTVDSVDRRPWNEKYGPTSLDELAVHKKKVADVRTWLSDVFAGKQRKRLLLLKGPAGSGKTATMSLLSKELGFHMNEWKNPIGSMPSSEGLLSATAQFDDFVGRTGAFGSLSFDEPAQARQQLPPSAPSDREKQLILVEEFPNTFTRTSSSVQSFRSSILNYLTANTPSATSFYSSKPEPELSITPIVMIVSETLLSTNTAAADSFTAHRLLGPEILTHPGVTVIEFNPIAPTFMTKALDLIVLKEARKSGRRKTVGPQVIHRLSELGDIRSAVSSLEFLCLRGDDNEGWGSKVNFTKKKGPKDVPLTKMEQESLEMVTQRESTLGIFHAVGRVVYNKRLPEDANDPVPQPPNWLPDRRRPKASEVNVDALIDELGTDTQTFIAALHENYALSCDAGDSEETMDCMNGCIDALSDADLLSPDRFGTSGFGRRNFSGTSADNLRQDEMCFQTSVRGLLFSLPHPVKRIPPPPGVMGMKAKGAGTVAGASKGNAYVMYYPASLRIWRQQEEIGGLLEMWISRAQRGELLSSGPGTSKPAAAVVSGVDTWRKTTPFSQAAKPTATQVGSNLEEEPPPPVLLGSGGSARYEMLLERLPYLPTILRKSSMPSLTTASTIRGIQKITSFTGSGISGSAEDDDQDDERESGEQEQWATDKPGAETPKKKKRVRIEHKAEEMESAIPGGADKAGGNLVLSDDDIED
ncbi:Rad17-domain-containing protein [Trematosphaeria pertusa]|uniref:Rad17-domain-containing protein n=1 Tax=Trematosphaeria pertusa TaxID=390896 RepID=A0A6A6ISE1_9PLEO|nr:Rad17-domain-containing protein [Trematosphaeria pertusa]KAF2253424.1 Rad17-domain-containing protein [Trematosphaeria pertusa]